MQRGDRRMVMPALAERGTGAAADVEARFWRQVAGFEARYAALWDATSDATPRVGARVGRRAQRATARESRRLIDHLAERIESYPDTESARRAWRAALRRRLQRFGEERLGWPGGYRDLLFAEEFYEATVEFARQARAFDPRIGLEDVGQALRNVWIMNSLQMLLDREVTFSPAIFAYSMLYPYTDNYLDDPGVPPASKRALNDRLGRRLAGRVVAPGGPRQRQIFDLVGRIEAHYPRHRCPEVFLGLQAIHRAQVASLELQGADPPPREAEIVAISVAKGGASVLADGYLTAGSMSPGEADFCFGYGVFLQFLDDLQDAVADRDAGHATLFSRRVGEEPLDRLAARLDRYMHRVVEGSPRFGAARFAGRRDLILRNCRALLVGAVAESPELFTRGFRRSLERRWPLRFRAMRRLRKSAQRRFRETLDGLRQRRGIDSVLDLLD